MRRALVVALMSLGLLAAAVPTASADPREPLECDDINSIKRLLECTLP